MSVSMMRRTAPLALLCCRFQNGGGVCGPVKNVSQKHEEELDDYADEADGRTVKAGNSVRLFQLQELTVPELEKETRELLTQLYSSHTGLRVEGSKRHCAVVSVHRVVQRLVTKHRIAYRGMVRRLFEQADGVDSVRSVLQGVFSDGVISWGRIVSMLALGAVVCEQLKQECEKEQRAVECVDVVVSHISSYLCTDLQHWFISNNGWDGLVEFFHVEDPESTVLNTLMAVAGLGIGVCLFTLM